MKKTKMPKELKEEILKETEWNKIVELENKYAEKYLLDDEIIQHEIEAGNFTSLNENYYIRKNK